MINICLFNRLRLLAVSLLLFPGLLFAELPVLGVKVVNVSPAEGTVEVTLFNSAEHFMKEAYLQKAGKADESGTFEVEFVALPEGEYAVVAVHDANDNGQLDNGFMSFGGESYAFSNDVTPWFGWPKFEDAKFIVNQSGTSIEIRMD